MRSPNWLWFARAILAVCTNALVILWPRIISGLYCPPNDLYLHFYSAQEFVRGLSEGVIHPRWAPDMFGGLGAPLFVFYSPLYYYAVSFFNWLAGDLWNAIRAVDFIANSLCGFLVMFFFRGWGMSFGRSWTAALLLQSAPFFLLNLGYLNGLPWYAANVSMCLLLFATADGPRAGDRMDLRVTLAIAGLALTHLLSAFMALACIPAAVFFAARAAGGTWKSVFARCFWWGVSASLGLCLAACFLLPAATTSGLINAQKWRDELDWRAGFLIPVFTKSTWNVFQYAVGSTLVAGAFAAVRAVRTTRPQSPLRHAAIVLSTAAAAALLWSAEISYPIWAAVGSLQMLQYPYRFFQMASIATACSLALTTGIIAGDSRRWLRWSHRVAMMLWFALAGCIWMKIYIRDGRPAREDIAGFSKLMWNQKEYLPAHPQKGWQDYLAQGGFSGECQRAEARLTGQRITAHRQSWSIAAARPAVLRLPLFAYPCWRGTEDGAPIAWRTDPASGLVSCNVREGVHTVEMAWSGWPMEQGGRIVSSLALAVTALIVTSRRMRLLTFHRG
jgi:hypothetical protein